MNPFKSYRESVIPRDRVDNRHVIIGEHTYYSGYYHGKDFNDSIMYLDQEDHYKSDGKIDKLIIGKFCSIATGVKFMMGGNHGHDYNVIASYPLDEFDEDFDGYFNHTPKMQKKKGDTIIGNDVWFGAESLIMPGVNIGDGAVIAARAVIVKNIGPYEIWGGNPAKFIKKRFSDDDIKKLLEIKWWDWSDELIKRNLDLLRSSQIEALWKKFNNKKI
jgi:chloramphenicol O-acetyltransferase type B